MTSRWPSNRDIFHLFCSLDKGELRNLRVMLNMEGKRDIALVWLPDELYRLRGQDFDGKELRESLDCDAQTLRRAMVRVYETILLSRTHYHSDNKELIAKVIADLRFLIGKGMMGAAWHELNHGLSLSRQCEAFEAELDLLRIRRDLPGSGSGKRVDIGQEIPCVEDKMENLRTLEGLKNRLKGVRQGPDAGKHLLRLRSLAGHPILQTVENCKSIRAAILFHDLKYRIGVFMGHLEVAADHLNRKVSLLESHGRNLGLDERELLEGRLFLAQLLLNQGDFGRAQTLLGEVWKMDIKSSLLSAARFEGYCSTQLGFATDSGDQALGMATVRLVERHFPEFEGYITEEIRVRLLLLATRFLLFSGHYNAALRFFDAHQPVLNSAAHSRFSIFYLSIDLLASIMLEDEERVRQRIRQISQKLQSESFQVVPVMIRFAEDWCGHNIKNQPVLENLTSEDTSYEMNVLGFDLFLDARATASTMMEVSARKPGKRYESTRL